ncbi:MAG: hypothetical protein RLY80_648 [Actinomycetota bacterium]|jgi:hypothetical protein
MQRGAVKPSPEIIEAIHERKSTDWPLEFCRKVTYK